MSVRRAAPRSAPRSPIGPNRLDAVLRAGINAAPRRSYADALQGVPSSATRPKKGVDTLLKAMEKTAFPNPWLKSRRDQLLKALQDDAASNDELFKEVSKLKTLLKELRGELELDDDARGERIQTLETRVKEEEAKVAALTKRLENVQVEKGDAVEVIGKLEAKLAEQTVRSETLAEELQLAETEKQLDDENSTTIIKDLDVQIANLKDQIAEAERQATGTRTELVIHKAALEEMENRLLRQMTERDIVVQDLKAWQQDLVDETAGLKRTREALSSIENLEVNIKPPPELGERVNSAGI